jgi:cytochrome c oxidase subunit IV
MAPLTKETKDSNAEHDAMERSGAARYYLVFAALIAGTILTVLTSRIHLPGLLHVGAALLIASVKSLLVVMFFMHLWDHGGANRLVFGTSVFFVVVLIGITVMDNATRFPLTNPGQGRYLGMEPPGPDILTPRGPPQPSRRVDTPPRHEPGHAVPGGTHPGEAPVH